MSHAWRCLILAAVVFGAFAAVDARATQTDDKTEADLERGTTRPRVDGTAYPLDAFSRELPPDTDRRRLRCDTSHIHAYRGTTLRYHVPAWVHEAFLPTVQRFERIVSEVAIATYGRAPRYLSHIGAYNCRLIRGGSSLLSEHAFGNAIDIRGFDFYGARSDEPLPEGVPAVFRRSFRVRVEDHFHGGRGVEAFHATFFERLCARLAVEPDLFRVMLGPSYPGHNDHLHLDRAPFLFVQF